MKRSEMIEIIQLILDVMPNNVTNKEIACAILNRIEEKGMLAPKLPIGTSLSVVHDAGRNVMSDLSWYMWEPE